MPLTTRQKWYFLTGAMMMFLVVQLLRSGNDYVMETPEARVSTLDEEQNWHITMDERFRHRQQILEENCQKYEDIVIKEAHVPPYMHTAKTLLTCPISKAGTTTWKTYMFRLIGQNPKKFQNLDLINDTGHWVHHESKNLIDASNQFSDKELISILRNKNYPVIQDGKPLLRLITVRPPMDRLISAFKMYKDGFATEEDLKELENGSLENGDPSNVAKSRKKRRIKLENEDTSNVAKIRKRKDSEDEKEEKRRFEQKRNSNLKMKNWITKTLTNTKSRGRHWKPYDAVCSPCYFKYDYILHLETFEEDIKYIYEKAGLQDKENTFNIKFHQTKRKDKSHDDEYFSSLPKQVLKDIYKKYRQDFYLFGYELPYYLKQFEST